MITTRGIGGAVNNLLTQGLGSNSVGLIQIPKPKLTIKIHLENNEIELLDKKNITLNLESKAMLLENRHMDIIKEYREMDILGGTNKN